MRRILGLNDRGNDVVLVQEALNKLMPFQTPTSRRPKTVPLVAQASFHVGGGYAGKYPLKGPIRLYSWGMVSSWADLRYVWGSGALHSTRAHHGHAAAPHLRRHGKTPHYVRLKPDGHFGSKTEAAVKAFQELNGLPIDGIVGPATWELLIPTSFFTICGRTEVSDRSPTDMSLPKGWSWWQKPDDQWGCYSPVKVPPGGTPPAGSKPLPPKTDDDKPGIKVEVQIGLQSGHALTFVLGQIIFVQPRGPNDYCERGPYQPGAGATRRSADRRSAPIPVRTRPRSPGASRCRPSSPPWPSSRFHSPSKPVESTAVASERT